MKYQPTDPNEHNHVLEIDRKIKKVKSDAFVYGSDLSYVLLSFDGSIKECLEVFEKPTKITIFVIACNDGTIQFVNDVSHVKAKDGLSYFFCHHGLNYLTDDSIVNHNFVRFLERRFDTYMQCHTELFSYSDNDAQSISNFEDYYCILDLDNFLKIVEIDYEHG